MTTKRVKPAAVRVNPLDGALTVVATNDEIVGQPTWWRLLRAVGWIVWVLGGYLAVNVVVVGVLMINGVNRISVTQAWWAQVLIDALTLLLVVGVPYLVVRRRDRSKVRNEAKKIERRRDYWRTLGLARRPHWSDLLAWAKVILIYYATILTVNLIMNWLLPASVVNQQQNLGYDLDANYGPLLLTGIMLLLVVITPIFEELLFRGLLFGKLTRLMTMPMAIFITSLVFAMMHGQVNVGVMTFILSFFSCYLRRSTGALYSSILLHMTVNGIASTLLYLM